MKVVERIQIPEEIVVYIQRLDHEARALKSIVNSVLFARKDIGIEYNEEYFNKTKAEYVEKASEFNLAMTELLNMYAPGYLGYRHLVDFLNNELVILEGHSCKGGTYGKL